MSHKAPTTDYQKGEIDGQVKALRDIVDFCRQSTPDPHSNRIWKKLGDLIEKEILPGVQDDQLRLYGILERAELAFRIHQLAAITTDGAERIADEWLRERKARKAGGEQNSQKKETR